MSLTCLVIGGANKDGSRFMEDLLSEGNVVMCMDSFKSNDLNCVANVIHHPNFIFVDNTIEDEINFMINIDEIYDFTGKNSKKIMMLGERKDAAVYFMMTEKEKQNLVGETFNGINEGETLNRD